MFIFKTTKGSLTKTKNILILAAVIYKCFGEIPETLYKNRK